MPFFLPPLSCFLRSFTALPKDFKSLAALHRCVSWPVACFNSKSETALEFNLTSKEKYLGVFYCTHLYFSLRNTQKIYESGYFIMLFSGSQVHDMGCQASAFKPRRLHDSWRKRIRLSLEIVSVISLLKLIYINVNITIDFKFVEFLPMNI